VDVHRNAVARIKIVQVTNGVCSLGSIMHGLAHHLPLVMQAEEAGGGLSMLTRDMRFQPGRLGRCSRSPSVNSFR
jgi:hypothetical protein